MSVETSSSQAELHCVLDALGCVDITYFDHKLFDIQAVTVLRWKCLALQQYEKIVSQRQLTFNRQSRKGAASNSLQD